MRNIYLSIMAFVFLGCGGKIGIEDVDIKTESDGRTMGYLKSDGSPFTGTIDLVESKQVGSTSYLSGTPASDSEPDYIEYRVFEFHFKDGKAIGIWKWWYENGELETKGVFKKGYKDNVWLGWDENGNLEYEEFYKDGVLIKKVEY